MEKPVIISILGTQTDAEGIDETIEFLTYGSLKENDRKGFSFSYEESELTGMDGTTTTFEIEDDRITMQRKGTLNSELVFQEGARHTSLYDTGFGGLMVSINTKTARTDIDQNGGSMELFYRIEVENRMVGENRFHIEVKERQPINLQ